MLVLNRKRNETICIGEEILSPSRESRGPVSSWVDSPSSLGIRRAELGEVTIDTVLAEDTTRTLVGCLPEWLLSSIYPGFSAMHQSPVSAITLPAIAAFIALLGFTPWLRPDAAHAHPPVPTQSPATRKLTWPITLTNGSILETKMRHFGSCTFKNSTAAVVL